MPLFLAKVGEQNSVKRVSGRDDTRRFLASLGFVPGSSVTVVTQTGGNVIVHVKQSRVAISREMAAIILI